MNKYSQNQCPDSICSVYFPSSLKAQDNFSAFFPLPFCPLTLSCVPFEHTQSCSTSEHEDADEQGSDK